MPGSTTIFNDNNACVNWSKCCRTTKGLSHIKMKENHVWENVERQFVTIQYICGKMNLTDLFTKEMKDITILWSFMILWCIHNLSLSVLPFFLSSCHFSVGPTCIMELSPLFFTFSRFASTGAYVRRNDVVSFSWKPQISRLVDWVLELQTFLSALILPILCQAQTLVLKSQPKSHLSWPCFLVFSVSPLCIPVVIVL
jgi:hypothetical protein